MKEMLTFGTKNVHYTCDGKEFAQTNSIAMESPLRPVLADIFMAEVEKNTTTFFTCNFYKHLAPKTFGLLASTLFPHLCKISRPYLVSVSNY